MTLILLFTVQLAAAAEPGEVQIEVTGLQEASGNIFIAVYDSEDNWLGEGSIQGQKVSIEDSREGGIVFAELQLPPGEYALSIFYDANGNGKMDTNFIGIPKEPVAMSNNAKGKFGPPKYEDAKFVLGAEPVVQRVSMEEI
jgi:uncharacterized protein (DUF2141 family)